MGNSFRWLIVIIDDDEPFAADEGFIDLIAIQIGKIGEGIVPELPVGAGMGLQKMVVEELVNEHGIVVGTEFVVAAAGKRVASGTAKTLPKLVEPRFVLFREFGRI